MGNAAIAFSSRFKPRWRFIAGVRNAGRVLELGCGNGVNFRNMQALGSTAEFHGIDIMPEDAIDKGIIYHCVDLDTRPIPYPDATFDAILFTHVIEHLRNPLAICAEINRVLKPGGRIYVETPNWTTMYAPSFGFHREQGYPFNFFDDPTHVKAWSKQGLYGFLRECGLRVERVGTIRVWVRIPWDALKMLYGLAAGKRELVVNGFWNVWGWCIYGIGRKA